MENSSFSKINPHLQVAWDSTSLGVLKECPYKYYLAIIEGWRPKKEGHDLTFGLVWHSALELYDKKRAEGVSHEEAVHAAVRHGLEKSGTYEIVKIKPEDDDSELRANGFRLMDPIPDELNEIAYLKFHPWPDEFKPKTRPILIRSIVWYLEQFGENAPEKTVILENGKPAVELSFRYEPGWELSTGESVILCGHLDKLAEYQDQEWIFDKKTTKSTISDDFFKRFSPDNQMSMYAVAGQVVFHRPVAGVIIDGAQLAVGFTRFSRGFAHRTPGQLEEWLQDTREWIEQAERYATRKIWPMNDKSCFLCQFKDICRKDPSVRQSFLESNYERRPWDPLKPR